MSTGTAADRPAPDGALLGSGPFSSSSLAQSGSASIPLACSGRSEREGSGLPPPANTNWGGCSCPGTPSPAAGDGMHQADIPCGGVPALDRAAVQGQRNGPGRRGHGPVLGRQGGRRVLRRGLPCGLLCPVDQLLCRPCRPCHGRGAAFGLQRPAPFPDPCGLYPFQLVRKIVRSLSESGDFVLFSASCGRLLVGHPGRMICAGLRLCGRVVRNLSESSDLCCFPPVPEDRARVVWAGRAISLGGCAEV